GFEISIDRARTTTLAHNVAIEYSVPYLQQAVRDFGLPWPLSDLIGDTEFNFEHGVNGEEHGQSKVFVTPGFVYMDRWVELGVAGRFPLNQAAHDELDWASSGSSTSSSTTSSRGRSGSRSEDDDASRHGSGCARDAPGPPGSSTGPCVPRPRRSAGGVHGLFSTRGPDARLHRADRGSLLARRGHGRRGQAHRDRIARAPRPRDH